MSYSGQNQYELKNTEYTNNFMTGFVYKTKEEINDGTYVGFYIPKILPLMDTSSGPKETSVSINKSIFANSNAYRVQLPNNVTVQNYIKIAYNGRSNFTQPLLGKGESALIYFLDGDFKQGRYTDDFNSEWHRKTDVLSMYVYGNNNILDPSKGAYRLTLDSINKEIYMGTGQGRGEPFVYFLDMSVDDGFIYLGTSGSNRVFISQKNDTVVIINKQGSFVQVNKNNIDIECKGTVSVNCKKFEVNASSSVNISAGSKATISSSKTTVSGSSKVEISGASVNSSCSKFTTTAPVNLFGGIVSGTGLGVAPSPGGMPSIQKLSSAGGSLVPAPKGNLALASTSGFGGGDEDDGPSGGGKTDIQKIIPIIKSIMEKAKIADAELDAQLDELMKTSRGGGGGNMSTVKG